MHATTKLQIATILNSVCFGLLYTFISPYIVKLGAGHVTASILAVSILFGELLAEEVSNALTWMHGTKFSLFILLNTATASHFLLPLSDNYWIIILIRFIFSLTRHSQNLIKKLAIQNTEFESDKETLLTKISLLNRTGYIVGPIGSGYFFDHHFTEICMLAGTLTFLNTVLIFSVPRQHIEEDLKNVPKDSSIERALNKVKSIICPIINVSLIANWELLAVKYLFSMSTTIFFTKFTQILKYYYRSSSIVIGYTTAYINILNFSGPVFVDVFSNPIKNYPPIVFLHLTYLSMAILMLFACFAPLYAIFLALCIPIIVVKAYMIEFWKNIANNDSLNEKNQEIALHGSLVAFISFGIVANFINHYAVVLFSVLPQLGCFYITKNTEIKEKLM